MYIRFYAELISILLKINYLPRTLKGVIDFLPPFRAWGKRRKSIQLIMHKSGQSIHLHKLSDVQQ
jgi:hypothetical protein